MTRKITHLLVLFLCFFAAKSYAQSFAKELNEAIAQFEEKVDLDPEDYTSELDRIERKYGTRKDPVEQAVAHAVLAELYNDYRYSYDAESHQLYEKRRKEHIAHIFDDVEALYACKCSKYSSLDGFDGKNLRYTDDMLAVIVEFATNYCNLSNPESRKLHERIAAFYALKGNRNAEAIMLSEVYEFDELKTLLNRCLDIDAGMDVALAVLHKWGVMPRMKGVHYSRNASIYNNDDSVDEQLRFVAWVKNNVKMSTAWKDIAEIDKTLREPLLNFSYDGVALANREFSMTVNYRGIKSAAFEVRKYNGTKKVKGNDEPRTDGAIMCKKTLTFGSDSLNLSREAENLPVRGKATADVVLPAGYYVLITKGFGEDEVSTFRITSMCLSVIQKSAKETLVYVLDRETGRPMQGVKVLGQVSRSKDAKNKSLVTDAQGKVVFTGEEDGFKAVKDGDDETNWVYSRRNNYGINDNDVASEDIRARLFTNRSIYRPKQTVMGSVIAYTQKKDELKTVSRKLKIQLQQNSKVLKSIDVTTNDLGSAEFSFELPDEVEVGMVRVVVKEDVGNRTIIFSSVKVEEYKRPTFDVSFAKGENRGEEQAYMLGDSVTVYGKAMLFSGLPVQGATVKYRIQSAESTFRWWHHYWQDISSCECLTNNDGEFSIPLVLSDSINNYNDPEILAFRVLAIVTDLNGESHEAEWAVYVSDKEYNLSLPNKNSLNLDKDETITVTAKNANNEEISVVGEWTLKRGEKQVANGQFTSGKAFALPPSVTFGKYTLEVKSTDKRGNEITEQQTFWTVTERPGEATSEGRENEDFALQINKEVSGTQPAEFYFSPCEYDAYIIYNVYAKGELVESKTVVLDRSLHRLAIPYSQSYGDGLSVSLFYVRNGHECAKSFAFTYVKPDLSLKLSWQTFRAKLVPGQNEQWVLSVKDAKDKSVSGAEMMAVLYDASLDRIASHDWRFLLHFDRDVRKYHFSFSNANQYIYNYHSVEPRVRYKEMAFGAQKGGTVYNTLVAPRMAKTAVSSNLMATAESSGVDEFAGYNMVVADGASAEVAELEDHKNVVEDFSSATLRKNFAETAFFLPHLLSDKKGNVNIAFTLPESLTEWKFMGFVHTNDLHNAIITDKVKARKAFVVRPNIPRFVRWGDSAQIVTAVSNQADNEMKGTVRMRLLNPEDESEMLVLTKPFSVAANSTADVAFSFVVPENLDGVNCEIIAVSGETSDGEMHYLPVLSTKERVVQTLPFYIIDEGEKALDLSHLFNENSKTASEKALRLTYTDNPSWMCVEALRSSKLPEGDDAVSLASALSANVRLIDLMSTFPILNKTENADSLRMLADNATKRLKALQQVDGGWSWFEGMNSSRYITLAVCEMLARHQHQSEKEIQMLASGMVYLDSLYVADYQRQLKNRKNKIYVSDDHLRYLYLSSLMPERQVNKNVSGMRSAYLSKAEKEMKNLTIYGTANIAYAFNAFGKKKAAGAFVDRLKHYAIAKPGQGRFYATNRAYYSWMDYKIPTHTAAMRAISACNSNDTILNDMLMWLIAQKQVQKWDNAINTLDVVDLMLQLHSKTQVFHEAKCPEITGDGVKYDLSVTDALMGTVESELPVETKKVIVKKPTPSISWGAVEATFYDDMASLSDYSTSELSVARKLYVERGGKWTELNEDEALALGEKVRMRCIIKADRDMDFVRLTVQHPACFEPTTQRSGYTWLGTRGAYVSRHDSNSEINFDWFSRGTTTIDLEFFVSHSGTYQQGIATVNCAYATQFGGYTKGTKVNVK